MRKLLLVLLVLILSGCGTIGTPNGGATEPTLEPPQQTASPAPADETPTPDARSGDTNGSQDNMVEQIKQQLAAAIDQPASALTLESREPVEWSDGSLGCPKPGMMYTQAIVPGYKLTFSDGSRTYEIHVGRGGIPAIWCDRGQPKPLG
jgi:hypothetical protein